jgi:hypothetical protein
LIGIGPGEELSGSPVNRRRPGTRHVCRGAAAARGTQKTLQAEALGTLIARRFLKWSRIPVRGLRDRRKRHVENIVTRAAVAVRGGAIGVFGGCQLGPEDALNERRGFEKPSRTREPSRLDEADRESLVRNHDVPSRGWMGS